MFETKYDPSGKSNSLSQVGAEIRLNIFPCVINS